MTITANILQRTFHIKYNEKIGTCFTIDVESKRYMITARHIVEPIRDKAVVYISHDRKWVPIDTYLVGHGAEHIDITVLSPIYAFGASYPLKLTMDGLMLAEDVYFLGFPYGLGADAKTELNMGFPLPFIKKAIVSAIMYEDNQIFLDGHNNPGFSGGPIARRSSPDKQTVIGVISGYRYDRHKVRDKDGNETTQTYDTNTGIIIAHNIKHALEIIAANPVGFSLTKGDE